MNISKGQLISLFAMIDVSFFRINIILMKKIATLLILLLAVIAVSAQDITGTWTGTLSFTDQNGQPAQLRVNFNISATDQGYTSTLDSPDQNTYGYAVDTTYFQKPELTIKVANLGLVYVGKVVGDTSMEGTLTQMGQTMQLDMKKQAQ